MRMKTIGLGRKGALLLLAFAFIISNAGTVFAKDYPTSKPNVVYGSSSSYGYTSNYGPWPQDKWNNKAYSYRYDSWDSDEFVAINASANRTLSTSSTSTYKITGSTAFDLGTIAKVNLGGDWGETWGKTITVTYDAAAGYSYHLWSANKILQKHWEYIYDPWQPWIGLTTLTSMSHGKVGTISWFFKEPI